MRKVRKKHGSLSLCLVSCFLFLVQKFTGREIERPREGLAQCVMQTILLVLVLVLVVVLA